MSQYQNQNITVVRNAQQGDAGFDATKPAGDQLLIKLADGTQKVVARVDVKN